jgi:hypothetical protein
MKNNLTMLAAAVGGLFSMVLIAAGCFGLLGFLLSLVWTYAVVAVWPTLPTILWWQFGLMAFGLSIVRSLIVGKK